MLSHPESRFYSFGVFRVDVVERLLFKEDRGDYIQTVPKRGYRFVGDVKTTQDETVIVRERVRSRIVVERTDEEDEPRELKTIPARAETDFNVPETMYARSGDVNIAYQVIGDAPLDLVFVMGWVSHLEYFWREPNFARFLLRLASFSRLILGQTRHRSFRSCSDQSTADTRTTHGRRARRDECCRQ